MEQYKKAHKKVGKKAKKSVKGIDKMVKGNDITPLAISLLVNKAMKTDKSIKYMRLAIWALVIFSVVMTAAFMLVLFGNQYLIK